MTLGCVNPASAVPPPGGFLLTEADAAYADWIDESVGGTCKADLFVGFVEAKGLNSPLASKPIRPHSDLQVILTVSSCAGGGSVSLMGVKTVPATLCIPVMDSLVSATVNGANCNFTISGDGATATATINNLVWTTTGDIVTETFHSPGNHSAHRTRTATLAGSVTIQFSVATPAGLTNPFTLQGTSADDVRMTHDQEIQLFLP